MKTRDQESKSYFTQLSDAIESIKILFPAAHYVFWGLVSFAKFVRDSFIQRIEDKLVDPAVQKERGTAANLFFTGLKYAATASVIYLLMSNPLGWSIAALAAMGEYVKELRNAWDKGPWEDLKKAWADTGKLGDKAQAYRNVFSALGNLIRESIKSFVEFLKVIPIGMIACAPIPVFGSLIALGGCAILGLVALVKSASYIKQATSRAKDDAPTQQTQEHHPGNYENAMSAELRAGHTLTTTAKMLVTQLDLKPEQVVAVGLALASTVGETKATTPETATMATLFKALENSQPESTTQDQSKSSLKNK